MLAMHPGIHIFDRPRTYEVTLNGLRVAFLGFPYARAVRFAFPRLLAMTDWTHASADVRLLCVHQCFEGATVGPVDYTFRFADDVIRHADVPALVDAVLSGHIHRHQLLRHDLQGHPLATPVFYPGSIERTSFAERGEPKGFLELALDPALPRRTDRYRLGSTFRRLPARPMLTETVQADTPEHLSQSLQRIRASVPRDAILRLEVRGPVAGASAQLLSAANLRTMMGPAMNVEVRLGSSRQLRPARGYIKSAPVDNPRWWPDIIHSYNHPSRS